MASKSIISVVVWFATIFNKLKNSIGKVGILLSKSIFTLSIIKGCYYFKIAFITLSVSFKSWM